MMQCRMCSQPLTRPGKLCRECEHELGRARAVAASVDALAGAVPLIDAARMAGPSPADGWTARLRSRPALLATAFSVGLASAAGAYVAQRVHATSAPESVMLDRDLRNVRPRSFGVSPPAHVANFHEIGSPPAAAPEHAQAAHSVPAPAATPHRVSVARSAPIDSAAASATGNAPDVQKTLADAGRSNPVLIPVAATAPGGAPTGLDRVLALSNALETCGREPLFSRIACEYRARIRYCDGVAGQLTQCGGSGGPVDHGQ